MKSVNTFCALALAGALGGALATSAVAQPYPPYPHPDGTIHFGGGSVAFIAGVNWGGGRLNFHGRHVPLSVSGIGVGEIGVTHFNAEGEVYHLRRVADIQGTYTTINASATAGAGAGVLDMQNQNGVEIRAHSSSEGLALSLAPTGMVIRIK